MIPNITHSTGSGNYLGYNLGDKKEQYQRVQFLAAEGVMYNDRLIDRLNQNWVEGDENSYQAFRKVAMEIANDFDDQFLAQAALNGRPKIRAINVSLSYSPLDTDKVNEEVYDETKEDYVPLRLKMDREFLKEMGFDDIQYVAVSHLGTHCAHDHFAINTVRSDGSTINLKYDFVRAQKVAAEIRQKYGLSLPDESLQRVTPYAKEAKAQSCTWEEYGQRLQEHGIGLVFSDHSKNGRGYGVSYSFGTKVIPGSKLHRSLSYGQVDATLQRNLAARQAQEEASRIAAQQELARQKAEAEARVAAEKLAGEPETFVIHNDADATLYSNRPSPLPEIIKMLHEATRSILKYRTRGTSVRHNQPEEFVEDAVNGQQFGMVKYDMQKAHFVGDKPNECMLENPDEVIQFADHYGQTLDLFTPGFWSDWQLRLVSLKNALKENEEILGTSQSVEIVSVQQQKQEETPKSSAESQPDAPNVLNKASESQLEAVPITGASIAVAAENAAEEAATVQQEQAKAKELRAAYGQMIPTIQGLNKVVNDTFQLYNEAKQVGIAVNAETGQKYDELKQSWNEFRQLNQERRNATTAGALIKGIGGMMVFLNPVAGLLAIVIGRIATHIRLSNIQSEKKALLSKIEGLKSDIESLQQQKAQIKIEKQERLKDYLQAKDVRNEFRAGMDMVKEEIQQLKEQTKPKFTFDFKAARQQAASTSPAAQTPAKSTTTATPPRSTVDISSILLSAKDKDSLDFLLLDKKVVIEPIKDRFGGVSDFKVTLAAEGRVINASCLVPGDQMRQMVDKWETLTGEQPAYRLEIQRGNQRKLADICAKMDAASPENAPRIPRTISFLPGGEIKVSYYNSGRRKEQDIMVDANGKMKFNDIELDINTGKYTQFPGQRQAPHRSQGESNGEEKGYGRRR